MPRDRSISRTISARPFRRLSANPSARPLRSPSAKPSILPITLRTILPSSRLWPRRERSIGSSSGSVPLSRSQRRPHPLQHRARPRRTHPLVERHVQLLRSPPRKRSALWRLPVHIPPSTCIVNPVRRRFGRLAARWFGTSTHTSGNPHASYNRSFPSPAAGGGGPRVSRTRRARAGPLDRPGAADAIEHAHRHPCTSGVHAPSITPPRRGEVDPIGWTGIANQ